MLPEMRNEKQNEKRERYEKQCFQVSYIRNEERKTKKMKIKRNNNNLMQINIESIE